MSHLAITQEELDLLSEILSPDPRGGFSRRILSVLGLESAAFGSAVVHEPVSALVDARETSEWLTGFGQLLKDSARYPCYRKYLFLFRRDGEEVEKSLMRSVRTCCAGFDIETFDVMEDLWSPFGSAAYSTPPFVAHLRTPLRRKLHEETDTYSLV